ncbi:hypothetical protein BC739_005571 [Kutzneria viridogrisea]|uniref:Lipoprotein n=1 Tax=Kutzneria viridogrisea TaxID=47990 RepID=A0ABR6BN83_9PSEU|nr:hypothetical protein [Kutzneria viridogrisea]
MSAVAVALLAVTGLGLSTGTAGADTGSLRLSEATTVGVHNTYDKGAYTYLADALDAGAGMIELDAWFNIFTRKWNVSHSNPLGSDNNCVQAKSPTANLHTGNRDQNLNDCLDDVNVWLAQHPGAGPLTVKLELKAGFDATIGMGPAHLDDYVRTSLGSRVFKPADLMGGKYATLDDAARANNWPSRSALAGKVIVEVIPGTVEEGNPTDHLWTDVEYARYLRDLAAAGHADQAQIFPAVHNSAAGDPRTRYSETNLRPWFVVFDGDASSYVDGGIDTSFYVNNHYYLVMTDAHNVKPAIDDTNPTEQQAKDRVALLAAKGASVVGTDWRKLTAVLPEVLPRT